MPAPDSIRTAARRTAQTKLAGLAPGRTGINLANEVADAILDAAWSQICERLAQQLLDANPDRDADFSAGVDWAADTIRNA
jgi:hypothetical protein